MAFSEIGSGTVWPGRVNPVGSAVPSEEVAEDIELLDEAISADGTIVELAISKALELEIKLRLDAASETEAAAALAIRLGDMLAGRVTIVVLGAEH